MWKVPERLRNSIGKAVRYIKRADLLDSLLGHVGLTRLLYPALGSGLLAVVGYLRAVEPIYIAVAAMLMFGAVLWASNQLTLRRAIRARIGDSGERLVEAELAKQRATVQAKAHLMHERLATRNHGMMEPGKDTRHDSYLAAMWDAEQRGEMLDGTHASTFPPKPGTREQEAQQRTAYELRKLTSGIGDPVAMGARLLEQDQDRERKRSLIAKGRDLAHRYRTREKVEAFETFMRQQRDFFDIQPHLGLEYQQWVARNDRTVHITRDGSSVPEAMFLRELARLEKEWGLI